ncbi:PspA/IM30 family protein [Xanthovirga aplysinae]|uniref:PspA/IM30 family protein n=1 Tax=Xanthovirga aplysinae TaxID=2529853 RepID=UPI0012BC94EA|nr:PspA/IM30 family protein [Xanthovirga aplysinae]MTI32318.1 PspA/IM30 family protein [Xanthovirga aplysinae]
MNFFSRLFKIGQAEAHSAIDKLEDPIKMTEQGIRDMKKDLDQSLQALAEVKAMVIRARNDHNNYSKAAKEYEQKAILLLQKAQKGEIPAEDADRLAGEALTKKEENQQHADRASSEKQQFEKNVDQLEANVKKLRSNLSKWENELKTLKARVKVSSATKKFNKQMAQIDSSSTVSMLEKMKDKVAQEEALAESYGDIANESRSVDEEIDKVLGSSPSKATSDLDALKAKLGMNTPSSNN